MSNNIQENKSVTDELLFTLDNVNPVNEGIFVTVYAILKKTRVNDIDNRLRYLMSKGDSIERSHRAIHTDTIYREVLRLVLRDNGIVVMPHTDLRTLLDIYDTSESIRSHELISDVLADISQDDCELLTLSTRLDVPLVEYIDSLDNYDEYIKKLYSTNVESILSYVNPYEIDNTIGE